MTKPEVKNFPTEYFGYPYTLSQQKKVKDAIANQYCHYLAGTCFKFRKSQPEVKIGVCSLGYTCNFLPDPEPVIMCPFRFREKEVFSKIERECYPDSPGNIEFKWVPEVSMGVGGSVDYVLCKFKKDGDLKTLVDFKCIEFQSAGTTGTPWDALVDLKKYGKYRKEKYKFGVNWANEFSKTMMQQAYKKGLIVESWNKDIIFAVQDVCLKYLTKHCDTSGLTDYNKTYPIHFFSFKMVWSDTLNRWTLVFDKKISSKTEGIRRILSGSSTEFYPTMEQFKKNIVRKMNASKN